MPFGSSHDQQELVERVGRVAEALGYSLVPNASEPSKSKAAAPSISSEDIRLLTARAWLRASAIRAASIGVEMSGDPAWDMLLDLYVNRCCKSSVSITSAIIAARVPTSTGLRWVRSLEEKGFVFRLADPDDKRRSYLLLTMAAVIAIEAALDAVIDSDRKFGLQRMIVVGGQRRS